MAKRASKLKQANSFFVADDVHPQTIDVIKTRAETFGFNVIVGKAKQALDNSDLFGILVQLSGTTGEFTRLH
ncbi:Glycine dehydrogenase [decarboxylating] [Budvicia aquatica]|uniref:Glycine dehydrogenase [decarboxylating] n=1 Tax=Budvicia aquatica TaxID=82979 RepID=A0A485A052_9GAMM|nr:Glycine dehydrogenase [decarboxylating] [Budvicia aquatica]